MAQRITESQGRLIEGDNGRFKVQIITPGIGSSGYYSADVLESAAEARVFPAGTHMYIDHPSASDRQDRPERSIRDLAGATDEDAVWNPTTQALEAPVHYFPHTDWLSAARQDLGVSIVASADVTEGEIEGRPMPIIERLVEGYSIDYVTKAGRGGKILAAIESHRPEMAEATTNDRREQLDVAVGQAYGAESRYAYVQDFDEETKVVYFRIHDEDEGIGKMYSQGYASDGGTVSLSGDRTEVRQVTTYVPVQQGQTAESERDDMPATEEQLTEALNKATEAERTLANVTAERDRLLAEKRANDIKDDATRRATERLASVEDPIKGRVVERALLSIPVKDGALDVAAFESTVDSLKESEVAYATSLRGSSQVVGFGQTRANESAAPSLTDDTLRDMFPFLTTQTGR